MILIQFDLYIPLFQFCDNDCKTKEIQIKLVRNHFDLKFILTYNIAGVGGGGGGGGFKFNTVEPRYNNLRYNYIPDETINIFQPGQCYSKMYGTKSRFNDPRYSDTTIQFCSPNVKLTPT